MEKCQSWLGHKFRPRYCSKPIGEAFEHRKYHYDADCGESITESFERDTEKYYVGDICERCGLTIKFT